MNLIKPLSIAASIIGIAGCSSPLVYTNIWQSQPVAIDGKATEWKIPLDYYDDKTKLNFTVTNDSKNLYICVRATEDETQKGIIQNGLQIWIDTTGGKKSQVGIQFPIIEHNAAPSGSHSKHSDSYRAEEATDNLTEANTLKKQYKGATKQIKLNGFTNATNGLAEVPNLFGVNACLDWDTNGIMIYEACIPFSTFYKTSISPADSNKVLGLSFIVSITPKNNTGDEEGGQERGGADAMGGMGSGMHGGGHGSKGDMFSSQTESTHIKFRLAVASKIR